jgi:Fe-S-cluster-containing hydrogenase component 2
MIKIINEKCPENHFCPSVKICPVEALTQQGFNAPKVDQEKCTHCNKCVHFCPTGAIVDKDID